MKKLTVALACILSLCFVSHAQDTQENVGAGLGSYILQGDDGLLIQVVAAFLNGICCNQSFAITSGTWNAERPDAFVMNERLQHFVADNMDNLAQDIAMGEGETLETLAELMDVQDRHAFRQNLKANFNQIYSSDDVTHLDVLQQIETLSKA